MIKIKGQYINIPLTGKFSSDINGCLLCEYKIYAVLLQKKVCCNLRLFCVNKLFKACVCVIVAPNSYPCPEMQGGRDLYLKILYLYPQPKVKKKHCKITKGCPDYIS